MFSGILLYTILFGNMVYKNITSRPFSWHLKESSFRCSNLGEIAWFSVAAKRTSMVRKAFLFTATVRLFLCHTGSSTWFSTKNDQTSDEAGLFRAHHKWFERWVCCHQLTSASINWEVQSCFDLQMKQLVAERMFVGSVSPWFETAQAPCLVIRLSWRWLPAKTSDKTSLAVSKGKSSPCHQMCQWKITPDGQPILAISGSMAYIVIATSPFNMLCVEVVNSDEICERSSKPGYFAQVFRADIADGGPGNSGHVIQKMCWLLVTDRSNFIRCQFPCFCVFGPK